MKPTILLVALLAAWARTAVPAAAAESSAAACADLFDPNESCATSLPLLAPDGYSGLVVQAEANGDRDWYRIHIGHNETMRAEVIFRSATGSSTLALYTSCSGSALLTDTGSGTMRAVEYQNAGPAATYWLRVSTGDTGICHIYDMAVYQTCPDEFDPNEYCGIAAPIGAGVHPNLWVGGNVYDEDFYTVHLLPRQRIIIDLDFVNAQGNLNLGLFVACTGELVAASIDTLDGERIEYQNSGGVGDFTLFIDNQTNPACTPYSMTIAIDGGLNLDATVTPAGWDFPTVPRAAADATLGSAHVSPTLVGNQETTYLSQYVVNDSPIALPLWTAMFLVDGEPRGGMSPSPGNVPGSYALQNFGPVLVRGGRHTLGTRADYYHVIAEPDTTDNLNQHQFVWSPREIARATPQVRPAPPAAGEGVLPDADGFHYTRDPAFGWVIASAATEGPDCLPLVVYDDYSGSTSGFSHAVGTSDLCSWLTNFVVGHFDATPVSLYPAVYGFDRPGSAGFLIDATDSYGHVGGAAASFTSQALAENRLANLYEAYLTAGQKVRFVLWRRSGTADLKFEVFVPTAAGVHGRTDGTTAAALMPEVDRLDFVAPGTGYYPIVVFRDQSTDATPVTYDFAWSTAWPLDVDAPARQGELAFAGVFPNPLSARGRFEFTLPAESRVALDLFDAAGRRVRTITDGVLAAGRHESSWERRDGDGARVAAGIYWARLVTEGRTLWRRFVILP